jgi:hypothetical protein
VAAAIACKAGKGDPKTFKRETYWTSAMLTGLASAFFVMLAVQLRADVRTWQYPFQLACFTLGVLLAGVSLGCMLGIFTFRSRQS